MILSLRDHPGGQVCLSTEHILKLDTIGMALLVHKWGMATRRFVYWTRSRFTDFVVESMIGFWTRLVEMNIKSLITYNLSTLYKSPLVVFGDFKVPSGDL